MPNNKIRKRTVVTLAAAGLALAVLPAAADAGSGTSTLRADLTQLNFSGVSGTATVSVKGNKLDASIDATGLLAHPLRRDCVARMPHTSRCGSR